MVINIVKFPSQESISEETVKGYLFPLLTTDIIIHTLFAMAKSRMFWRLKVFWDSFDGKTWPDLTWAMTSLPYRVWMLMFPSGTTDFHPGCCPGTLKGCYVRTHTHTIINFLKAPSLASEAHSALRVWKRAYRLHPICIFAGVTGEMSRVASHWWLGRLCPSLPFALVGGTICPIRVEEFLYCNLAPGALHYTEGFNWAFLWG